MRAKALLFEDPRSRALLQLIRQIAPGEAKLLVIGETGHEKGSFTGTLASKPGWFEAAPEGPPFSRSETCPRWSR